MTAKKPAKAGGGYPLKDVLHQIDRLIGESEHVKGVDLLDANRRAFEANRGTSVYIEYLIQDGRLFTKRRRTKEAKAVFKKAEAALRTFRAREEDDSRLRQFLFLARADAERVSGEHEAAIVLLKEAIAVREDKDSITGNVYLDMAKLLSEWGRVPESVDALNSAIDIFEGAGDTFGLARSYSNLSDVYGKLENWDKAVEAAKSGIAIAKANGHRRSEGFSSLNCAEALMRKGVLDQAKTFIMEAQDAFTKSEDRYFIAALNYMLGVLQNKEGEHRFAAESLETSFENLEETDPKILYAMVHQEWAGALAGLGDVPGAKNHYEEAIAAWDAIPNEKEAKRVRETLKALK